jgi:neutral ceramidase
LPRRPLAVAVALAKDYGKQLAQSVDAVLQGGKMKAVAGQLNTAYTEIALPFDELPSRAKLADDALSDNKFIASRARLLLKKLKTDGALAAQYPYPVQAWKLGNDLEWITLGGEVVVDYALRLNKELHPGQTWVMGYANDVMAYIPSLRVLKEGGYEGGGAMVYYGLPAIWGPRVEELIVAAVHEQIKKTRGK